MCEHCGAGFKYQIIHNGFNESSYAYCDSCGMTALLDGWKAPQGIDIPIHQEIAPRTEPLLQPCTCGGTFKASAAPRGPRCAEVLSAEKATAWIEEDAAGTSMGWRWQRSWRGLYCIIVDDRVVHDNWCASVRAT